MAVTLTGQPEEFFTQLVGEINKLRADVAALRTALNDHTHGEGGGIGDAITAATAAPALTSTTLILP